MQGNMGCGLSTGAAPPFSSKSSKIGGLNSLRRQCWGWWPVQVSLCPCSCLALATSVPLDVPSFLWEFPLKKWDLGIHGNFRDSSATKHPLSSVIARHTPTSLLVSSHCKIVMMTQEFPLSFSGCYCAMLILSEIKTSSSI